MVTSYSVRSLIASFASLFRRRHGVLVWVAMMARYPPPPSTPTARASLPRQGTGRDGLAQGQTYLFHAFRCADAQFGVETSHPEFVGLGTMVMTQLDVVGCDVKS